MYKNRRIKVLLVTGCWLLVTGFLGCASGPLGYFHASPAPLVSRLKLAIIPFTNLTTEKDADKKVAYSLITHLINSDYFEVIEVGEVQKGLRDIKARKEEDLSAEDIKKIGQLVGADVLLMGVVEEYKIDSSTMLGERVFVPEAAFSTRLVSAKNASILWAANHHRRGDDRVTIFGMGRIDSISKLTDIIIKDTVNSLTKAMKLRDNAQDPVVQKGLEQEAQGGVDDVAQRKNAIKKAIKQAAKKSTPKEPVLLKDSSVKEPVKAEGEIQVKKTPLQELLAIEEKVEAQGVMAEAKPEPKDERQIAKEKFQAEYEQIENQYKKDL